MMRKTELTIDAALKELAEVFIDEENRRKEAEHALDWIIRHDAGAPAYRAVARSYFNGTKANNCGETKKEAVPDFESLVSQARATNDWSSLYNVFCDLIGRTRALHKAFRELHKAASDVSTSLDVVGAGHIGAEMGIDGLSDEWQKLHYVLQSWKGLI